MTLLTLTLAILYIVIVVMGAGRLGTIIDELFGKARKRKK
jgi:Sec-independent protein translocase protein TatA